MQPWDGWFDVLFWFRGFVFCPSFVFPHEFVFGTFGSLAGIAPCSFVLPRLGFVINLFFILLLSGAQLLGICQSEVWSHMFLESLTLEFVSIWAWAPLIFSIGKLQKLALAVWAWNFVSFLSIFCSNHSGTLFSSGVSAISMAPIRFFRLPPHPCIERWSCRHQQHRHCGCLASHEWAGGAHGQIKSDKCSQSPPCFYDELLRRRLP